MASEHRLQEKDKGLVPLYNLDLPSYGHLLPLFLFSMNDINVECRS